MHSFRYRRHPHHRHPTARPSHAREGRAGVGRPPKRRRVGGGLDRRCTQNHPASVLRAVDRACLSHMARLDLRVDELEEANAWYPQSRWGVTRATLLPKRVPPPQRPPSGPLLLLEWAHAHVAHDRLTGEGRGFVISETLYTKEHEFLAWPVFEVWLRFIGEANLRLSYQTGVGFGLVAAVEFKKGDKVAPGTSSHPSPSPPPRLYPLGTGAPTLAPTPTSTGFADYTTAEAGYQIKGPVGGDKGTARGPVSLVNWAYPKHVNTRYGQHPQSGGFSAVATRRIQVGESICAGYSTNVRMVCLGCDPHAFRTRTSQRVATSATSGAVR